MFSCDEIEFLFYTSKYLKTIQIKSIICNCSEKLTFAKTKVRLEIGKYL